MTMESLPSILFEAGEEEELPAYNYPYFTPGGLGQAGSGTVPSKSETIESGEVIQLIAFQSTITQGTPLTVHELLANTTNIQSASGKTAKIILMMEALTANLTVDIRSSATADTADGTILKSISNTEWDANNFLTVDGLVLLSSGFLTIEVTSGSGMVHVDGGAIIRQA